MSVTLVDRLIEVGVIGLLLFAPLPFGSVLPWAQAAVEGTVVLLVSLCVAQMLVHGELRVRWTPLLWPGLAVAFVIAAQLLLPVEGSVNRHATWSSFRLYLAYLGLILVLTHHFVTRARITRLLSILIGWGVLLAALGLANQMLGRAMILWFPKHAYLDRLTSTFVNANHQAMYFAILFFVALGLLLRPRRRSRAEGASSEGRRAWQLRGLPGKMLLLGAMALIGGALALTLSRGGLFGVAVGLLAVIGLSLHGRAGHLTFLALGGIVGVVVLYASWFGLDPVIERFWGLTTEPFGDLRWPVWEATLKMAGEAPLLGIGLGAFQDAFPLYRPLLVPLGKFVDYAHNDYLQLLAEVGVAGLLLMGWALVSFLLFVVHRWTLRHDPFVRGLTLGGLGALAAVLAHSTMDFGLHMPANALLVVVLIALLPIVVTMRISSSGDRVDLKEWSWEVAPRTRITGVVTLGLVVLMSGLVVAPPGVADWYYARATKVAGEAPRAEGGVTIGDLARAYQDLEWAVRLDPWNAAAQRALAGVAAEIALRAWNYGVGPDGQRLPASQANRLGASQHFLAVAYEAYRQSIEHNPRAAHTHDRFGWFLGSLEPVRRSVGRSSTPVGSVDARLAPLLSSEESLYPRALAHLRSGVSWDPQNAYRHQSLALFALSHLKADAAGGQVAADGFRQALSLEPALLGEVLESLSSGGADQSLVEVSIPRRYDLWLALARRLDQQGRRRAAASAFEEALALAPHPTAQVEVRLAYSEALLRGGDPQSALARARQALVLAPKNPEVFGALAAVYEATEKWEEAESALGSAVSLARAGEVKQANEYRAHLATYLSRRGQAERALAVRREIVREAPNDAWAHYEVARLLEQRRDWPGAFREYQTALGLALNDGRLYGNVARAYARNDLIREAISSYENAIRLRPTDGDLRMEVAELYARIGSGEQAILHYRLVLAKQPDHEKARRALILATEAVRKTGQ